MASEENIIKAVAALKEYYAGIHELNRLRNKLLLLIKNREKIENDINNSNIFLNASFSSRNNAQERVQQSGPVGSIQDREIDRAFDRLEKQLQEVQCNIINTNICITELEQKTVDMQFILDSLPDESRMLMQMKYKRECFNFSVIGFSQ